jgi:hypothetical protein
MMHNNAEGLARARRAYESERLRLASWWLLPALALAAVAAAFGAKLSVAVGVGAMLAALAMTLGWRGQSLGRAVFPGMVAGAIPLVLALSARAIGHVCTGTGCVSLCIPACSCGGVLAGLLIAFAGRRLHARLAFTTGAAALALLVGALGCSCAGYGGIVGLAVGLFVGVVPAGLRRRLAR